VEAFNKTIERELINVEIFRTMEEAGERIHRFIEHYNYGRTHQGIGVFTPADRYFGIGEEVARWQKEKRQKGNEEVVAAGESSIFLIGRCLGHQVRI
jgi:hypothetical protein